MKKGTKTKIEIKKRETKQQRAVACSKRRQTVFSKAADLCLRSGANVAVFVTSPSECSDVVYSFSGYSSAYEIADCYLNRKPPPKIINPQSKLRLWWEDPDLYSSCDDLSELNIIEEHLERVKKHVMARLEKKDKSQFVSSSDQNPYDDQNSYYSLDQICGEPCSQVASFDLNSEIQGESSSSDQPCCFKIGGLGWETEEENNQISLLQETQTQAMSNLDDESFWDDFVSDDVAGPNSDFPFDSTNDMIDFGEFFNQEGIKWLELSQFTY